MKLEFLLGVRDMPCAQMNAFYTLSKLELTAKFFTTTVQSFKY